MNRTTLPLVLVAVVSTCASAQPGGPGGSPPPDFEITTDKRVAGIEYGEGHQRATFTFAVTQNNANAGIIIGYYWTGPFDFSPSATHPNPTGTWKYAVHGQSTNHHTASCQITVQRADLTTYQVTLGSKPLYIIGGPLSISVAYVSPIRGYLAQAVPDRDVPGDTTTPWFLHAFKYNPFTEFPREPAKLHDEGVTPPLDSLAQEPQIGHVSLALPQLIGVTYEWEVTNAVMNPAMPTNSSTMQIAAVNGTTAGGITVRLKYKFTVPGTTTETVVYDDSPETPPPGSEGPAPSYYTFTGHEPSAVDVVQSVTTIIADGVTYTNYETDQVGSTQYHGMTKKYMHQLKDTNGQGIAGVVVQERFRTQDLIDPNGVPMAVHNQDTWWESKVSTGSTIPFSVNGHWVRVVDNQNGTFTIGEGFDHIGILLSGAWGYATNPQAPYENTVQFYYAATRRTQQMLDVLRIEPEDFWGIKVATYNNKIWTDRVDHIKQTGG